MPFRQCLYSAVADVFPQHICSISRDADPADFLTFPVDIYSCPVRKELDVSDSQVTYLLSPHSARIHEAEQDFICELCKKVTLNGSFPVN